MASILVGLEHGGEPIDAAHYPALARRAGGDAALDLLPPRILRRRMAPTPEPGWRVQWDVRLRLLGA